MNNLKKALELFVKDAETCVSPPPMDHFHQALTASRRRAERKAWWFKRISDLPEKVWATISKPLDQVTKVVEEIAATPAEVAEEFADTPSGWTSAIPSIGKMRTLLVNAPEDVKATLDLRATPSVNVDNVLSFSVCVPKETADRGTEWRVALVSKDRQEIVLGDPEIVYAGVETSLRFDLPRPLAEAWRVDFHKGVKVHEFPFLLLLDVPN